MYLNSVNLNTKKRVAMKCGVGTLIFGTLSFAGGFFAGLMLAPNSGKNNRKWIENQGRKIKTDSERQFEKMSESIRKTVKDSVPDLYEATEDLNFTEEEEIEQIERHG